MPAADFEDTYNTDLMDQIESALSPFDDGNHFSLAFGDTRSSHENHYQQMTQTANNFADDLVEQICMDNEYLSCVAKDSACMSNYSYTKNSANSAIHTRDMDVPEDIIQSAFALQNFTKSSQSSLDRMSPQINDSVSDQDIIESDGSHNKAYYKNFDELHKYSDLIQLPDMTSRYPSIASTSTQNEPVNYSQNKKSETVLQTHQFFDEDSNDTTSSEFMSWTTLHPENWSGTEVLDWLYYSAEKHGVDCSLLRGESFRLVSGKMLCNMNVQGFRELDPFYGDFLFKLFRQLLSGLQFTLNSESSFSDQSSMDQSFGYIESQSGCFSMTTSPSDVSHHSGDVSSCQSSTHTSPNIYQQGAERLGPYDFLYAAPPGSSTPHVDDVSQVQATDKPYRYTMDVHPMSCTYEYQPPRTTTNSKSGFKVAARERYDTNGTPRRRPGRPRVKSIPTEEEIQAQREKKIEKPTSVGIYLRHAQ